MSVGPNVAEFMPKYSFQEFEEPLHTSKSLKCSISELVCTDLYSTSMNWSDIYSILLDCSLNNT